MIVVRCHTFCKIKYDVRKQLEIKFRYLLFGGIVTPSCRVFTLNKKPTLSVKEPKSVVETILAKRRS